MTEGPVVDAARELQLLASPRTDVVFHGESMYPVLFEGDRVILEPGRLSAISVGDVVTYRDGDRYPTRRVVDIRPDRVVLWCDNWPTQRFSAAPADLLARVVGRHRDGEELSARDPEWVTLRDKALRRYRLARFGLGARAAGRALHRAARR